MKCLAFETPLGEILACANEQALYYLVFTDEVHVNMKGVILEEGITDPIHSIQSELKDYFSGKLKIFKTPLCLKGTTFQQTTWQALQTIPYGETRAYAEMAALIGKPTAFRALANANGKNPLSIMVPCHRVIHRDGGLGGYAGGVARKEWLLEHERRY